MEGMMENILTAIAVVINGIPQGILALTFGFAAFPTAIAFVIGIIGSAVFMSVATISFQAETITLAGTLGKNMKERLSLIFWGAALLLIPSLLGMNEALVDFIGPLVVTSMMAGVGIMLANVSVDLFKSEKWTGGVSVISALLVWFWTKDLAQTIIWSVIISTGFYAAPVMLGGPSSTMFSETIAGHFNVAADRWPVGAAFSSIMLITTIFVAASFLKIMGRGGKGILR